MRDFLSAILKRDYRVRVVATGEEVLTVLKKEDIERAAAHGRAQRQPAVPVVRPDTARRQVARYQRLEVLKIARENYSLVEVIMVSAVDEGTAERDAAVLLLEASALRWLCRR